MKTRQNKPGRFTALITLTAALLFFGMMAFFTLRGEDILYKRLPKTGISFITSRYDEQTGEYPDMLPATAVLDGQVYALYLDRTMRGQVYRAWPEPVFADEPMDGTVQIIDGPPRSQPLMTAPWPGIEAGEAVVIGE